MKHLITTLLALAALASLPGTGRAQALVDLQVLDLDRHQTLPRHAHRGRHYIEGQPGHRYAVVLQNLTGERVLAVVSVDGVNAISGETAGSGQSGYVLGPWQRLEVRGWRKNLSEVAEFQFTSLGDSYAARTGRPANVGVIGVAAFREKPVAWAPPPYPMQPPAPIAKGSARGSARDSARLQDAEAEAPASASAYESRRRSAPVQRQELGTAHGQRRWDAATTTRFERASHRPDQVLSVWYDSTQALVARGVLPRRWHRHMHDNPQAFPIGFAPDP